MEMSSDGAFTFPGKEMIMDPKITKFDRQKHTASCPVCMGETAHSERPREYRFTANGMEYSTRYIEPYDYCASCDLEFTGPEAEERQHDAICKAMGRLTAMEIADLEANLGCTAKEFCDLLGIGEASLRRWKRRASIQDASNDRLLRIAQHPTGRAVLREIAEDTARSAVVIPFSSRSLSTEQVDEIRAEGRKFRL